MLVMVVLFTCLDVCLCLFILVLYSLKAVSYMPDACAWLFSFSIYSVLAHLYYLKAGRCTRRTYMAVCYVCFVWISEYLLHWFFILIFIFIQFCLSLFTEYHQVYEMYVAGFKFHLLNNAFTSHWGFQVQQDKVLLKTTKVKRFIIRKIIRKKLIPGDFNNHLTALALADRKKTRRKCSSRIERKT